MTDKDAFDMNTRYLHLQWPKPLDGFAIPKDWQLPSDGLITAMKTVQREMGIAMTKHGRPTSDPVRGGLNLAEECGEVATEALEATRRGVTDEERKHHLRHMYDELAQTAAYAIWLMMSMEKVADDV